MRTFLRKALGLVVLAVGCTWFPLGLIGDPSAEFRDQIRPLLDRYCVKCHGETKPKAGLNLAKVADLSAVFREPDAWEKVLQQLRDRQMPPEGKPQPAAAEYQRLVEWTQQTLENPDPTFIPRDPGRRVIHRLSRTEYNNTVRDLLGVDGTNSRPADSFPVDGGGGGGFDNNAETLFVPPILLEKYLAAADDVLVTAKPDRWLLVAPAWYRTDRTTARANLRRFLPRAWRRPVMEDELGRLLTLYDRTRNLGLTFEPALKTAYRAALVSPNFLFRVERELPSMESSRITDYELASRLSYFLWSSMPDDELFRRAETGDLSNENVLSAQVRRMLRDPRSRALAENFAGQWLGVRQFLQNAGPDPGRFTEYTAAVRAAVAAEPIEFFDSLVRSDGSLLDVLDCDYALLNDTLASHYGIAGVLGGEFRKVSLTDHRRGGVVGMGTMLIQTSYPLRTSPVLRGKWILEEILGTPPPPPPPLVKTLPPDDRLKDGLSFRQRLEKHRQDPNCAGCHQRMDPLGFSLENFDATGRWRSEIEGQPVDSGGVLVGGEAVNGPESLKKALLARQGLYRRHVSSKMLAFALGRGLEWYDRPVVREIAETLSREDHRVSALVLAIVKSRPFQWRRGRASPDTVARQ